MDGMADLILRAVRGENLLSRPRWPGPDKTIQLMVRSWMDPGA